MPLEDPSSPCERILQHRRRERWRDWLIFILCAIVIMFIALARHSPVEPAARASSPSGLRAPQSSGARAI